MKYLLSISLIINILLISCNTKTKKKLLSKREVVPNNTVSIFNQSRVKKEIQLLSNDGIVFNYELGTETKFGKYKQREITYTIQNKTNREIYYIAQTCNGLDYYLKFKSEDFKIAPLFNCNATFPIINKLKPKEEKFLKTHFLHLDNFDKQPSIGLDFRVVNKYIEYEELTNNEEIIENVYNSKTKEQNIIWRGQ